MNDCSRQLETTRQRKWHAAEIAKVPQYLLEQLAVSFRKCVAKRVSEELAEVLTDGALLREPRQCMIFCFFVNCSCVVCCHRDSSKKSPSMHPPLRKRLMATIGIVVHVADRDKTFKTEGKQQQQQQVCLIN